MLIIKTAEDRERCTSCYGNIIVELTYEIMAKEMGISLHCPNYIDISRLRPEKGQKR